MSHLKIVPPARPKRGSPNHQPCMRVTLWFTPAQHLLLMQRASLVAAGKVSMQKYMNKKLDLEHADEIVGRRQVNTAIRHMHTPPAQYAHAHARRPRRVRAA